MRYELKTIGIWSFTKVAFFFNLVAGFIFGLFYALFLGLFIAVISSLGDILPIDSDAFQGDDLSIGIMVIITPIFFAIVGAIVYTIIGIIAVALYNLLARMIGGMEFELNSVEPAVVGAGNTQSLPPAPAHPTGPSPPPGQSASGGFSRPDISEPFPSSQRDDTRKDLPGREPGTPQPGE